MYIYEPLLIRDILAFRLTLGGSGNVSEADIAGDHLVAQVSFLMLSRVAGITSPVSMSIIANWLIQSSPLYTNIKF